VPQECQQSYTIRVQTTDSENGDREARKQQEMVQNMLHAIQICWCGANYGERQRAYKHLPSWRLQQDPVVGIWIGTELKK
jgi:hypothetical protein